MISEQKARSIAEADAAGAYRDLSIYKVTARFEGNTWYIDYDLADENMLGGGPHYTISAQTGEIINRRYEQ